MLEVSKGNMQNSLPEEANLSSFESVWEYARTKLHAPADFIQQLILDAVAHGILAPQLLPIMKYANDNLNCVKSGDRFEFGACHGEYHGKDLDSVRAQKRSWLCKIVRSGHSLQAWRDVVEFALTFACCWEWEAGRDWVFAFLAQGRTIQEFEEAVKDKVEGYKEWLNVELAVRFAISVKMVAAESDLLKLNIQPRIDGVVLIKELTKLVFQLEHGQVDRGSLLAIMTFARQQLVLPTNRRISWATRFLRSGACLETTKVLFAHATTHLSFSSREESATWAFMLSAAGISLEALAAPLKFAKERLRCTRASQTAQWIIQFFSSGETLRSWGKGLQCAEEHLQLKSDDERHLWALERRSATLQEWGDALCFVAKSLCLAVPPDERNQWAWKLAETRVGAAAYESAHAFAAADLGFASPKTLQIWVRDFLGANERSLQGWKDAVQFAKKSLGLSKPAEYRHFAAKSLASGRELREWREAVAYAASELGLAAGKESCDWVATLFSNGANLQRWRRGLHHVRKSAYFSGPAENHCWAMYFSKSSTLPKAFLEATEYAASDLGRTSADAACQWALSISASRVPLQVYQDAVRLASTELGLPTPDESAAWASSLLQRRSDPGAQATPARAAASRDWSAELAAAQASLPKWKEAIRFATENLRGNTPSERAELAREIIMSPETLDTWAQSCNFARKKLAGLGAVEITAWVATYFKSAERLSAKSPPAELSCAICLNTLSHVGAARLPCAHEFHPRCLADWIDCQRSRFCCPKCHWGPADFDVPNLRDGLKRRLPSDRKVNGANGHLAEVSVDALRRRVLELRELDSQTRELELLRLFCRRLPGAGVK